MGSVHFTRIVGWVRIICHTTQSWVLVFVGLSRPRRNKFIFNFTNLTFLFLNLNALLLKLSYKGSIPLISKVISVIHVEKWDHEE